MTSSGGPAFLNTRSVLSHTRRDPVLQYEQCPPTEGLLRITNGANFLPGFSPYFV
jgi:hypothetical protein